MAGAGKKTFTAGEVLTASDVNLFLMEQSVMVFGGTAARSSAIPTPSEGMVSYRTDIDNIELYNGSSWVYPTGLVPIASATPSAQTAINFNNVFSSAFLNYVIYWNLNTNNSSDLFFKWRASGSDTSTGYGSTGIAISTATAGISAYGANISTGAYIAQTATSRTSGQILCFGPAAASQNRHTTHSGQGLNGVHFGGSYNVTAAAQDGFSLSAFGSTMTGFVKVYGLRD